MLSFLNSTDVMLLELFNRSVANSLFDFVFPFITNSSNWFLPLIIFYFYLFRDDWRRALKAFLIAVVCLVLTDAVAAQIIKPMVGRIRPSHELADMVRLLVGRGGKYSFPSNHAANSMAFAIVTGFFYPKMKRWLFIIPFLVGFSRVYVGVHYPGDVIAGAFFGFMVANFVLHVFSLFVVNFSIIMKIPLFSGGTDSSNNK
ncbi:MAG: hypothetical protein CMG31_07655 [Candidatus Marinimicrobia bacterium]|nr:hypothetical protein [Candidatus Neomarinimicrobiota bacterium]MDP7565041.1 phosphatase PAP2 family protein [Candidatus Neomarinimicrobiota bacterium]